MSCLGRRLHRLASDVAEDVLAARRRRACRAGSRRPRWRTGSAACAGSRTKDQQRAGPRPARHLRADRVERRARATSPHAARRPCRRSPRPAPSASSGCRRARRARSRTARCRRVRAAARGRAACRRRRPGPAAATGSSRRRDRAAAPTLRKRAHLRRFTIETADRHHARPGADREQHLGRCREPGK